MYSLGRIISTYRVWYTTSEIVNVNGISFRRSDGKEVEYGGAWKRSIGPIKTT